MKLKHLLLPAVAAGALAISGAASATLVWGWQGTLQDWQNALQGPGDTVAGDITDGPPAPSTGTVSPNPLAGDGDTTFTYDSSTLVGGTTAAQTNVTLKEEVLNGSDQYNVGFGWLAAQAAGTQIAYSVDTTDPAGLSTAFLDAVVASTPTNVTKDIYTQKGGQLLLSLSSNSEHTYGSFGSRQSFYVVDTVTAGNVDDIHNRFIPDPGTLSLLGIGMVGLGARRRMTKKAKA